MDGPLVAVIVVVPVALLVLAGIVSYNRLVRERELVRDARRHVEVELHRRHDLISNLIETVRTSAPDERDVLAEVTTLRDLAAVGGGPADRSRREHHLAASLRQLFGVAENHPRLRSGEGFATLRAQVAETEDRIATGLRDYNAIAHRYNTRIGALPVILVAGMFGFSSAEYFEGEDGIRSAPDKLDPVPPEDEHHDRPEAS